MRGLGHFNPIFCGFIVGDTIEWIADKTVNGSAVPENVPRCVDEVLTQSNTPPDCLLHAASDRSGPDH
jgi:hypothetical protein